MAGVRRMIYRGLKLFMRFILAPMIRMIVSVHGTLGYYLYTFLNYDRNPNDVFIVTYPKSGANLLQVMVHSLLRVGQEGYDNFEHISSVVPWFEKTATENPAFINQQPRPRILKTHLRYGALPKSGKFIYCARQPEDVELSYYKHLAQLEPEFGKFNLDEFTDRFLQGKLPYGSWFRHFRSWWPHRVDDNVLFLQFDDLRSNLGDTLEQVRSFLGVALTDAQRAEVLERCSPQWMRKNRIRFDPRIVVHRLPASGKGATFIRVGSVGGWKDELSEAESGLIQAQTDRMARKLKVRPGEELPAFLQPQPDDA